MYLTCWKKLPVGNEDTFDNVPWSTNTRITSTYYQFVVDDVEALIATETIRGYLVKQYAINLDEGTMILVQQTKFEKPISQRRVINAT